ncbi:molybdopterin dinucleotide binding domain-containing protein, partial [Thermodesulfobacteriota bacterium]
ATVMGDRLYYAEAAIPRVGDTKIAYEICAGVADRLGILQEYTAGKTYEQWVHEALGEVRRKDPAFPKVDELRKDPVVRATCREPVVAYREFIRDPERNQLGTPSGKIEIYSEKLAKLGADWGVAGELPPIPKYITAWEGPEDPLIQKYPLQCLGHHTKRRVHSTHDNNPWMEELEPQRVWMNGVDAATRGIQDGDVVLIFNDRGKIQLPAFVTRTIMPGVVSIPQGAWYTPDFDGIDMRGCTNTITKYHPTPGAKGNPQNTNLVEIRKV